MSANDDAKRYLANRQKEVDDTALYRVHARYEKQAQPAMVYERLAVSAVETVEKVPFPK